MAQDKEFGGPPMTADELKQLLADARGGDPRGARDVGADTYGTWDMMLGHLPHALARRALKQHYTGCKWFPSPAEMLEAAFRVLYPVVPTPADAWGLVCREIRRVGVPTTICLEGKIQQSAPDLPPVIARIVEGLGGFQVLCLSQNTISDRSRFMDAFTILAGEEIHRYLAPPDENPAELEQLRADILGSRAPLALLQAQPGGGLQRLAIEVKAQ